MAPSLHELLSEPLGVYHDHNILSEECRTTPQNPVELEDVMLEYKGQAIGLTYCEHTQPEYGLKSTHSEVRMRGILEVRSMKWLSETGRKTLLGALRKRDFAHRQKARGGAVQESNFELRHIFDIRNGKLRDPGTCFRVVVQAKKAGPAVYLTSNLAPGALVILTGDRKRSFKIVNMHVETYIQSRLYFSRYRALYDLRQLANRPELKSTPLEDRTPQWFMAQYIEHFAYQDHCKETRPIFLPDDGDIDSDHSDGRLVPGRRRVLRRLSRAEVASLVAMHARWLMNDQKRQKQNKIFDPAVWKRWIPEARKCRASALEKEFTWGVFHGETDSYEEFLATSDDDDRMEVDADSIILPATKGKGKKTVKKSSRRSTPCARALSMKLGVQTRYSSRTGQRSRASPARSETLSNHYDSDFTTDGEPSSDDDWDADSLDGRPPSLFPHSTIPVELMISPEIPESSISWICPVRDCYYEVDPGHLNPEQKGIIGPEKSRYISSGRWSWKDPSFMECFHHIVSVHYEVHLQAYGWRIVEDGNKSKLQRILPPGYQSQAADDAIPDTQSTPVKEELSSQ